MKSLLSVLAAAFSCAAVFAADSIGTLRVGVYTPDGYYRVGADGQLSGYGHELHARLAACGGWEVEYVGAGKTWVELVDMLARGDIDALGPAQANEWRRQVFDFPEYAAGYASAAVAVREEGSPCTSDASSWNGRRAALVRGSYMSQVFEDFVREHGLTVECLYFDREPDVMAALRTKQADLAVVDSAGHFEGVGFVAHLMPQPFYTMLHRGDPALKSAVDAAYAQLYAEDPEWVGKLARKHRACRKVKVLLPHVAGDGAFVDYNRALMDRLAEINDWAPEYLPIPSDRLPEMAARVDIVAGVPSTPELRECLAFPMQPAGVNRLVLAAPAVRAAEFAGKPVRSWPVVRIACRPGDADRREVLKAFAAENGLRYRLVACADRETFARMVAADEADVWLSTLRFAQGDYAPVAELGESPFYFALPDAGSVLRAELDAALERLRVYSHDRIETASSEHLKQPKRAGKEVVVAAYLEPGLVDVLEDGSLDGFNIRYIRRVAEIAGWRLRFVPTSFGNALRYLDDGVADVAGTIFPKAERDSLLFSKYDMGPLYYTLKTTVDGRMLPNRPETWEGARIAVLRGSTAVAPLEDYLARHGVTWQAEEFDNLNEAEHAASMGRVDAVYTLASYYSGTLRTLVSLPTGLTAMAFNRKKLWIKRDADQAMKAIRGEDPMFAARLADRFFPGRRPELSLDPDEIAYVKARADRPVLVGVGLREPPILGYDTIAGELTGFAAVYAREIENMTGLRFTARAQRGDEELLLSIGEPNVDDFAIGQVDYVPVPTALICRPGEQTRHFRRLALRGEDPNILRLADRMGFEVVPKASMDACYRAVETREVDFAVDIYHRARHVLEVRHKFTSLEIRPMSTEAFRLRLPLVFPSTGDPQLRSIMRKASRSISDARVSDLMAEALAESVPHGGFTLKELLDALGLVVGIGLIILLFVMGYYTRRVRAEERAKSFFFSTVSHDIRTPLNAIVGFSEVLRRGGGTAEDRAHALEAIGTSGQTLLELINDVLDLSKLEAGKMDIVPESTDVGALVRGVTGTFEAEADKKGVVLVTEISEMPRLLLDPQRIRQILFNLIGNAVKFTDRGSVLVRAVWLAPRSVVDVTGAGTLRLSVEDTGCGIAPGNVKKLMRPYVQLVGDRSVGGTGLGLSICKQLATRMGGRLNIASELDRGTIVTLAVSVCPAGAEPEVSPAPSAAQAEAPAERSAVACVGKKPSEMNVLLVDDSNVNLAVLKAMLKQIGVERVTTAKDGREALAALHLDESSAGAGTPPFDLVLTDVWMPVMSGDQFVRAVRQKGCATPVYAVTADVESVKTCEGCGFTGIFLKPVTVEKLKQLFA